MPAASSPSITAPRRPGVHALQIEINRALYMDEATLAPHQGFAALEQAIASAMADCFARWSGWLDEWREAAE